MLKDLNLPKNISKIELAFYALIFYILDLMIQKERF